MCVCLSLQIAGLLGSLMVLLVVVAIGFVFQPLPQVGDAVADDAELPVWQLGVTGGAAEPFYFLPNLLNKQRLTPPLIQITSHNN